MRRTVKVSLMPAALAHDHGAGEDLDAFLVAFDDARVHVDGVADVELRGVLFR